MKLYLIEGDSGADKQGGDVNPIVNLCDDCAKEVTIIQEISDYDPAFGNKCYRCGKTPQEEAAEQE